jgi:hypothetical protein
VGGVLVGALVRILAWTTSRFDNLEKCGGDERPQRFPTMARATRIPVFRNANRWSGPRTGRSD